MGVGSPSVKFVLASSQISRRGLCEENGGKGYSDSYVKHGMGGKKAQSAAAHAPCVDRIMCRASVERQI